MSENKIFISYSRSDSVFVLKLEEDLTKAGIDIWLDQKKIAVGKLWDREINKALKSSGILILVISPNSADSDNVANEVLFAINKGKTVIPILIEQTDDIPFNWERFQRIDLTKDYEKGLNVLAQSLRYEMSQSQRNEAENEKKGHTLVLEMPNQREKGHNFNEYVESKKSNEEFVDDWKNINKTNLHKKRGFSISIIIVGIIAVLVVLYLSFNHKKNETAYEPNYENIIRKIESHNLYKKSSKTFIDSLKNQMISSTHENTGNYNQENRALLEKVNYLLKNIRKVQYSCASGMAIVDSLVIDDTLYYFKRCLYPKLKVIGWHYAWIKEEDYKYYNYNYLSAINLYGYELSPTGKSKNPKDLESFRKPGGVIKSAHENGCGVHLTVYNKRPSEITEFLNSNVAQGRLMDEIDALIKKDTLKGINIYFESMNDTLSKSFKLFIEKLRDNLNMIDATIELNITIPALSDDESLKEIEAYNFKLLNPMVNYYIVLTDRIFGKVSYAQSASPLYNNSKSENPSIESTIIYYSNGVIPKEQLIMSVSYMGVEWQVLDFSGVLKSACGKDIIYADILKKYLVNSDRRKITQGFDSDQAAPFLNVIDQGSNNLKQIWFENYRSLYLKYNWALENELGGVSIKGLGYDYRNPELWNTLGASLIDIKTKIVDWKPLSN